MMKITRTLSVQNPLGLHARPATAIAKLLQPVRSSVFFTYGKETVNAKSVLCILMLAAAQGAKISVTVEGDDAQDVMVLIEQVFESRFGEP